MKSLTGYAIIKPVAFGLLQSQNVEASENGRGSKLVAVSASEICLYGKGKERKIMEVLRGIVTVLYVLLCIALIVVVLMQEGKSAGLSGAINGVADTYWGKNKGRSMEGTLEKITKALAALFIILSIILTMNW